MNIASIRTIVESGVDVATLEQAEAAILEGEIPTIIIPGDDEGEQLTHVIAARWVLQHMDDVGCDAMTAIREYTKRVRASIS
jgi:hypothetical protein